MLNWAHLLSVKQNEKMHSNPTVRNASGGKAKLNSKPVLLRLYVRRNAVEVDKGLIHFRTCSAIMQFAETYAT